MALAKMLSLIPRPIANIASDPSIATTSRAETKPEANSLNSTPLSSLGPAK